MGEHNKWDRYNNNNNNNNNDKPAIVRGDRYRRVRRAKPIHTNYRDAEMHRVQGFAAAGGLGGLDGRFAASS